MRASFPAGTPLTEEVGKKLGLTDLPALKNAGTLVVQKDLNAAVAVFTYAYGDQSYVQSVTYASFIGDQANVDQAIAVINAASFTLLSSYEFLVTALAATAYDDSVAALLGLPLQIWPEDMTVTIKKEFNSKVLSFTATSGDVTAAQDVTVSRFMSTSSGDSDFQDSSDKAAIVGGTIGGVAGADALGVGATFAATRYKGGFKRKK